MFRGQVSFVWGTLFLLLMLELTNSLEQSTLPRDTNHQSDPEPVGFENDDVTTSVRKRARGKKPKADKGNNDAWQSPGDYNTGTGFFIDLGNNTGNNTSARKRDDIMSDIKIKQADRSLQLRNDVDAAPVNKRRRPQIMERYRFSNGIMSRPKNSKGVPHWLKNGIQAFAKGKNRKGRRPGEGKQDIGGKNETDNLALQSPGDYNTVGFFGDQGNNTNNTSERDRDDINSDIKGENRKGRRPGDGNNGKGNEHGDKGNMEGKPSPRNSPGEYMSPARYIRIRGMSSTKVNIWPGGFKAAMGAD